MLGLFSDINASAIVTDADLSARGPTILAANTEATRLWGYSTSELLGRTPRLFQGKRTDRAVLDQLKRDLGSGQVFYGATYNYRKDGSEFVNEWTISPIFAPDKSVRAYVSVQRELQSDDGSAERLRTLGVVTASALGSYSRIGSERLDEQMAGLARRIGEQNDLTRREAEVLSALLRGVPWSDIGEALGISPRTVKFHLGNLYAKLGVAGQHELYAYLFQELNSRP